MQEQKGEPMAEIKVPIQVNLPDDWIEQIVNRLRNDPEAEWVEVIRCKDCIHHEGYDYCNKVDGLWYDEDYCCKGEHGERREK